MKTAKETTMHKTNLVSLVAFCLLSGSACNPFTLTPLMPLPSTDLGTAPADGAAGPGDLQAPADLMPACMLDFTVLTPHVNFSINDLQHCSAPLGTEIECRAQTQVCWIARISSGRMLSLITINNDFTPRTGPAKFDIVIRSRPGKNSLFISEADTPSFYRVQMNQVVLDSETKTAVKFASERDRNVKIEAVFDAQSPWLIERIGVTQ
jgi:hypothetical protein